MKVLVPVDGSASSMQGVSAAIHFAKTRGAAIKLFTAIPPIADFDYEISASQRDAVNQSLIGRAEEVIEQAKSLLMANGVLPQYEIRTDVNSVANEICLTAEKDNADLIVIGRKGLKRFERAIMGSVTARVIGCSPVDVLVVPRDASSKWENILVASDGSKCSNVAVEGAIDIARTDSAELTVISVVDVPDEAYAEAPNAMDSLTERAKTVAQAVTDKAESAGVEAKAVVTNGDAHTQILSLAKKINADLICVGSHGRTGLRRFLMGSVTEKIIGGAHCPVLVVKTACT